MELKVSLGDRRLDRRCEEMVRLMKKHQSCCINAIGEDWKQKKGYYRLINNVRVKESALIEGVQKSSLQFCKEDGHYLAMQDTTAASYRHHKGRIKDGTLGWIANKDTDLGFFLHTTLIVDADQEHQQGIGGTKIWSRSKDALHRDARQYKKQAIEDKESWRWVNSIIQTRSLVPPSARLTFIQDREGDIFELFEQSSANTRIIVRSRDNRRIENQSSKLFEYLEGLPVEGNFDLRVRGDIRRNRKERIANIELRHSRVKLCVPNRLKGRAPQEVWAILAKEKPDSVPPGEEPVMWYLLTTHDIDSVADAIQIVKWYSQRWYIETMFRVMKTEGLGLEQSELEDGASLRRLALLSLLPAIDIMQLWLAQKQPVQSTELPCKYDEDQIKCLEQLNQRLQGQTEKLKNPHPPKTMTWVSWIIARLGGWSGYASQRPPGVITLIRGYRRFENLFEGWRLYDVYKQ